MHCCHKTSSSKTQLLVQFFPPFFPPLTGPKQQRAKAPNGATNKPEKSRPETSAPNGAAVMILLMVALGGGRQSAGQPLSDTTQATAHTHSSRALSASRGLLFVGCSAPQPRCFRTRRSQTRMSSSVRHREPQSQATSVLSCAPLSSSVGRRAKGHAPRAPLPLGAAQNFAILAPNRTPRRTIIRERCHWLPWLPVRLLASAPPQSVCLFRPTSWARRAEMLTQTTLQCSASLLAARPTPELRAAAQALPPVHRDGALNTCERAQRRGQISSSFSTRRSSQKDEHCQQIHFIPSH